jgi:hypothetical protein
MEAPSKKLKIAGDNKYSYTRCPGPSFSFPASITTKTIVTLVDELSKNFSKEYSFALERISEGGICMTTWPGNKFPADYLALKTFRFHTSPNGGQWPKIADDTLQRWQEGNEQIIWYSQIKPTKVAGAVYLKAVRGAPCWTSDEVALVVKALTAAGFKCTKTKIPKKRLCEYGDSGRPVDHSL